MIFSNNHKDVIKWAVFIFIGIIVFMHNYEHHKPLSQLYRFINFIGVSQATENN